jgi:S1 RNA binding domain protein
MALEKGSVVEGVITGIAKFGAFIGLPEGLKGLVHISEISQAYVTDINQHVKIGDKVKVKVLGETKPGKYDLSIKQLESPAASPAARPRMQGYNHAHRSAGSSEDSFEAKINRFLKQSDEKLLDLKKHFQSKQEKKKKIKFTNR